MSDYSWTQNAESVTVVIDLPEGSNARLCAVSIHQTSIEAGLKGKSPAIKGKLYQLVDADSSSWQIERDKNKCALEITLFKVYPGHWPLVISTGLRNEFDMDLCSNYHMAIKFEGEKALDQAIEWYKRAATLGHTESMCKLGYIYRYGPESNYPVDINVEQATHYYNLAADGGSANAQFVLGYIHHKGSSVPVDHEKAVRYYEMSALNEQGGYAAQSFFNMALIYGNGGSNVPVDFDRMLELLTRAACLGSGEALYNLGVMYAEGRHGLPKDDAIAADFFARAREMNPSFEKPASPPLAPETHLPPSPRYAG